MQHALPLDFILSFCREKIAGHGEDSFCYSFCPTAGMLGAFDGCGGAGARQHSHYSGHTEAYMASRICAGVFYDCFCHCFPCDADAASLTQELFVPALTHQLATLAPPVDSSGPLMRGSMVRTLPTTAAVALVQQAAGGQLTVSAIWAGDSRVYVLDRNGLAQLTQDDTTVPDPMDTLYEDGVLRNVLCSDRAVKLHCATVPIQPPFTVLTATDGCFGYVSTPMEFEGILLDTLLQANSADAWEQALCSCLGSTAGDDYTLCLAAFGYGSLEALQASLAHRAQLLRSQYLEQVAALPIEDRQSRQALWQQYRQSYFRFTQNGGR